MPARKKSTPGPKPYFYVYVMAYASAEVKKRLESGEPAQTGDLEADLAHLATAEYKAAQAVYRAGSNAYTNPPAHETLIRVAHQTTAAATSNHYLRRLGLERLLPALTA